MLGGIDSSGRNRRHRSLVLRLRRLRRSGFCLC